MEQIIMKCYQCPFLYSGYNMKGDCWRYACSAITGEPKMITNERIIRVDIKRPDWCPLPITLVKGVECIKDLML